MKRLGKFWRTTLFLGILALLLGGVSWAFVPKDNTAEAGIHDILSSGYLAEPVDSLDYVVLGDSVPKFAVMPPLLWKEQGMTGYVCAAAGGSMPKIVETARTFLERQSPKVVLLETNLLYRYIEPGYGAKLWMEQVFPVLRYHNNWKFVSPAQMLRRPRYTWVLWEKGHYLCKLIDPCEPGDYMAETEDETYISDEAMECLLEIRELCAQKNSRLILCSMPSAKNMNYKRYLELTKLADELGLPYLDMNLDMEPGIDWSVDSVDSGDHVNYWGAKKTTHALGLYLKRTGLLPDHRGEEAYRTWDSGYESFMEMAKNTRGNLDFDPDDV